MSRHGGAIRIGYRKGQHERERTEELQDDKKKEEVIPKTPTSFSSHGRSIFWNISWPCGSYFYCVNPLRMAIR